MRAIKAIRVAKRRFSENRARNSPIALVRLLIRGSPRLIHVTSDLQGRRRPEQARTCTATRNLAQIETVCNYICCRYPVNLNCRYNRYADFDSLGLFSSRNYREIFVCSLLDSIRSAGLILNIRGIHFAIIAFVMCHPSGTNQLRNVKMLWLKAKRWLCSSYLNVCSWR